MLRSGESIQNRTIQPLIHCLDWSDGLQYNLWRLGVWLTSAHHNIWTGSFRALEWGCLNSIQPILAAGQHDTSSELGQCSLLQSLDQGKALQHSRWTAAVQYVAVTAPHNTLSGLAPDYAVQALALDWDSTNHPNQW